ncbi:MAG TPA: energy transducer TonB [Myxococcota bacterium]|nr:energy transducer TonB [Myxococcota bacterium]
MRVRATGWLLLLACAACAAPPPGLASFCEQQRQIPISLRTAYQPAPPEYPYGAAANGVEGWVMLTTVIDEKGRTSNIRVIESSPRHVFEDAVVEAVSRWQYCPADTGVTYTRPVPLRIEMRP